MEQEENLEELRRAVQDLQDLLQHPGWDRLVRIAEEQVHNRTQRVMRTPNGSEYPALLENFEKGEASGIDLFLRLPLISVDQFRDLIKEIDDDSGTD